MVCGQSTEHMAGFEGAQVGIWQNILVFYHSNLLIQCFKTENGYYVTL